MPRPVQIIGGDGRLIAAKVSDIGQLVVSPFDYDLTQFVELALADSGYTFYLPRAHKRFVVTAIKAKADRDVSNVNDATVVIYEAAASGTTTVDKVIHQEAMIRGENTTMMPLNVITAEGKYINAKTTDADIHMTIMGYFVPV